MQIGLDLKVWSGLTEVHPPFFVLNLQAMEVSSIQLQKAGSSSCAWCFKIPCERCRSYSRFWRLYSTHFIIWGSLYFQLLYNFMSCNLMDMTWIECNATHHMHIPQQILIHFFGDNLSAVFIDYILLPWKRKWYCYGLIIVFCKLGQLSFTIVV